MYHLMRCLCRHIGLDHASKSTGKLQVFLQLLYCNLIRKSVARPQRVLDAIRRSEQSSFIAAPSSTHAMLALPELHCEFNRTPNVPYLDIKAAFDSVDRRALWKALRSIGLPDDQFTPNVSVQFCLGHGLSAVKTRLSARVSLYCVIIYDFRFYGICHRSRKSKFGAITSATWCTLTTLPSSLNPPPMLSAAYPVSM